MNRTSIIVITTVETNRFGYEEHIVSHGIDTITGKLVIMQAEPVKYYGNQIKYCPDTNEFWLYN